MALGDLVKSVVARFSVDNFEEVKAALADIPDEKDVNVSIDVDQKVLSALGGKIEKALLGGAGSGGAGGGIVQQVLYAASSGNFVALAGGAALGLIAAPLIAQVMTAIPAIVAAVVGTAAFAALAYPTISAVVGAFTAIPAARTGVTAAQKALETAQEAQQQHPSAANLEDVKTAQANLKAAQANVASTWAALDPAEQKIYKGILSIESEFGKMATALQPTVDKLGLIGLTIVQKLLPALQPLADAAGKALVPLFQQLSNFVGSPGFHQFVNDMTKLSGPAITAIGEGIGKVAVAIGQTLEKLTTPNSIRVLSDIFNTIAGIIKITGDWAVTAVNNTARMIGAFEEAGKNINQWSKDAENDVTRFVKFLGRIPGDIATALSPSNLFKIGADAIGALIRGMESVPVIGPVLSIMAKIASHIPHSPALEGPFSGSGAPEARGRHLAESFAAGMLSGTGAITAAASSMAYAAVPSAGGYATGGGRVQIVIGPSSGGLDQLFRTWLKQSIRTHGGNPDVIGF